MNNKEELNYLLGHLISEKEEYNNIIIPNSYTGKKELLRVLMNIRPPTYISDDFLKVQNSFLKNEIESKGIIDLSKIDECSNFEKISLWKGDITGLKVDGIVNAANSKLLGCFEPGHYCIDNTIHSFAGIQLRNECDEIMKKQGFREPVGKAKITKAYNLPSKFILHTVGPKISGKLSENGEKQLKSCYISCFNLANINNLKSLAFSCISTGEFKFPKNKAAKIAISTIIDLLKKPNSFERIIFNVFSDEDYRIYKNYFNSLIN